MHSGGSVCGSEALRGLSKIERTKEGKKGGVVRVVYIGILLPEAGTTMTQTFYATISNPDLDPTFSTEGLQEAFVINEVRSFSCVFFVKDSL